MKRISKNSIPSSYSFPFFKLKFDSVLEYVTEKDASSKNLM